MVRKKYRQRKQEGIGWRTSATSKTRTKGSSKGQGLVVALVANKEAGRNWWENNNSECQTKDDKGKRQGLVLVKEAGGNWVEDNTCKSQIKYNKVHGKGQGL